MPAGFSGAMGRLHAALRSAADRLGARGSRARRTLSPVYGMLLLALSRNNGLALTVNRETFRIDSRYRSSVPAEYEPELAARLRACVGPGALVFDVGANIGIWVLQAARMNAPDGRVVAFEPNPATAEVLRRHVRLNGISGRVTVEPIAVGARTGRARLFGAGAGAGTSRLDAPNPDAPGAGHAVDVEVTTLDGYCGRTGLVPAAVLVDVEGAEADVLEGATELVRANPRMAVFVEMHPGLWASGDAERMRAIIRRAGRRARAVSGQRNVFEEYGQISLE